MVDPETVDTSTSQQLEGVAMHAFEHVRIFHPDGCQLIDVEKAAVVDFFARHAPVRQSVRLRRQQRIEPVETPRVSCVAVERFDGPADMRQHRRRRRGQRRQAALDDLFLAARFGAKRLVLGIPSWPAFVRVAHFGEVSPKRSGVGQAPNGADEAEEFDPCVALRADLVDECLRAGAEDLVVRAWRYRERLRKVADAEGAVHVLEADLLPLEHRTIAVAKNRQEDLVFQLRLQRVPVDVENRGVPRAGSVFQHVLPPRVGRLRDAHVVRHEVDDVPHVAPAQRLDEPPIRRLVSDLRIEPRRIRDVVAVCTARHRAEVTRRVDVRNPERVEVVHDPGGVVEGEGRVELQSIRRGGSGRRHAVEVAMSNGDAVGLMRRGPCSTRPQNVDSRKLGRDSRVRRHGRVLRRPHRGRFPTRAARASSDGGIARRSGRRAS